MNFQVLAAKAADTVLGLCLVQDIVVSALFLLARKYWSAGYWAAAGVIVICLMKGMQK
jgi:hypothetical protein